MGLATTLKLRFRVGDLDLPKRRERCAISREGEGGGELMQEGVDAQMYRCGKAIESRSHTVRERETFKEERDVFDREMRKQTNVAGRGFVH